MPRFAFTLKRKAEVEHWRDEATYWHLSDKARLRLEWMIFYATVGEHHASRTAAHFGISTKTFYKWHKRFKPAWVRSLEDQSKRPKRVRQWAVTAEEEARIIGLRQRYLTYGKAKLKRLYEQEYGATITTWRIERVIRAHELYPDREAQTKREQRRQRPKKVRITQVDAHAYPVMQLWHVDSIIQRWYGTVRVIVTGLEHHTRLAYARVYAQATSHHTRDFLQRLRYLSDGQVRTIHSDNGSEFAGLFVQACRAEDITQVYSRVKQPQDNPALERFNRTLQEEWLAWSAAANADLTLWLVEYNSHRPHAALGYLTPLVYAEQHASPLLPMSSAHTPT